MKFSYQHKSLWFQTLTVIAGLVSIFSASTSHAETFSGYLRNNGPSQPLEITLLESSRVFRIEAAPVLTENLRRLQTGDILTAQGKISLDGMKLKLESIDRVGLQKLLGAWKSTRWEIFEFSDFTNLNLYVPTFEDSGSIALSQIRSLKYVVTPENVDRFTIFMSDTHDVRMGFIEVGKNQLTLSVTDFYTGLVTENILLSPLVTNPGK